MCVISGGNNDVSRYGEVLERSLVHLGLKHYFLVDFPQEPGALRRFLDTVLGANDDITLFEYVKRNNRETGEALVGVELGSADRLRRSARTDASIRHPCRNTGAGLARVPLPALGYERRAVVDLSSPPFRALPAPMIRRWRERSAPAGPRSSAATSVEQRAPLPVQLRDSSAAGPRQEQRRPWCPPRIRPASCRPGITDVIDVLRWCRGRIGIWVIVLFMPPVAADKADPQQPLAEAELSHQRPPSLAEIRRGMNWIGGGFDRRYVAVVRDDSCPNDGCNFRISR